MNDPLVVQRPAARVDLAVCYAYIGERNLGAAHRFRVNAETTFADLARSPGLGMLYEVKNPRLTGLRCFRVKRFKNHLVFYLPVDGGIEVVRVLHAARDLHAVFNEEI